MDDTVENTLIQPSLAQLTVLMHSLSPLKPGITNQLHPVPGIYDTLPYSLNSLFKSPYLISPTVECSTCWSYLISHFYLTNVPPQHSA